MTTVEIPVYQQSDKTYCQDCRPHNGNPSTLVTSSYRHCCDGCGESFKEMAEEKEQPEPHKPGVAYTVEEIKRYAETCSQEREQARTKRLATLKARVQHEGSVWVNVIFHAVPSYCRDSAYDEAAIKPAQLDHIEKYLNLPRCKQCNRLHTSRTCSQCGEPCCEYCEWGTANPRKMACKPCAIELRRKEVVQ